VAQTVDQTMRALFAPQTAERAPIAQLGAGPDGISVLARKGEELYELVQPSFAFGSPRWKALEARLRTAGAVDHPAIRHVLGLESDPPTVVLEGDRSPPPAWTSHPSLVDKGAEVAEPRVSERRKRAPARASRRGTRRHRGRAPGRKAAR